MPYMLRPPERVSGGSPSIRQSPKQKDTRKPENSDTNNIFKVKTDFFHEPKYVMINISQKKFFFYRHCIPS